MIWSSATERERRMLEEYLKLIRDEPVRKDAYRSLGRFLTFAEADVEERLVRHAVNSDPDWEWEDDDDWDDGDDLDEFEEDEQDEIRGRLAELRERVARLEKMVKKPATVPGGAV